MKRKNKKVVAESLPVNAEETIKNARAEMKDEDFSELRIQKSEATPIPQGKPAAAAPAPQNAQKVPPEVANPVEYAVMRPVAGGLQPIIAPRGQVQLNPVVVPVAFVPYATQNQPVLQIDNKPKQQQSLPEVKDQPLDKKAARAAKRRDKKPEFVGDDLSAENAIKKTKAKNRAFAAILFVITLGFFAFVILNHFADKLKITSLALAPGEPDIIAGWMNFNTSNLIAQVPLFLYTVVCAIALATLIVEFVGLCNGRGYHIWISALILFVLTVAGAVICATVPAFKALNVPLNPIAKGSFVWRLAMVSVVFLIFALCFIPRKPKFDNDDDLSDLI